MKMKQFMLSKQIYECETGPGRRKHGAGSYYQLQENQYCQNSGG